MIITNSTQYKALKKTLDKITTDQLNVEQPFRKVFDVSGMEDAYIDDLEVGGTALLQQKAETAPMALGTIVFGGTARYLARTFALAVGLSEESLDDNKYSAKCLAPAKRLNASAKKTQEIDAESVFSNSTNSAVTGGYDNLPLASASHKIAAGGTFSNILTYATPSVAAVINARVAAMKLPDPNGLVEGRELEGIICPIDLEDVWRTILETQKLPGSNWNDKNVTNGYGLKIYPFKYMSASSATQYLFKLKVENGLRWLDRKKIESRSWVENSCTTMYHGVLYRAAFGWSDPRCVLQGNT